MTKEEARNKNLIGWNLKCNLCGEYPATWNESSNSRPGWGFLALCEKHMKEYDDEEDRHRKEMYRLRKINFEQDASGPYHGPQVWD